MLTRTRYQEASSIPHQQNPQVPEFKKGHVVMIDSVQKIVIAKLAADAESPITYSVCDTDMRNPTFGISLDHATLIPSEALTDTIKNRALNFV